MDVADIPDNRLEHYHRMQKMFQLFWQRWSSEYVRSLQQRIKWKIAAENVKIGALVLFVEDNTPPLYWKLGRIIDVHPGKDKIVRVVTVRTQCGTFKRAVQKVCVLPIEEAGID